MKHKGERFIHQREPRLHTTHPVELEQTRKKRHPDETATQKPADKLSDWFDVLERTHLGHTDNPKVIKRLKDYYKKEHVISTDEVPERYFDLQKQIAREEGHGDIEIGERQRTEMIENIQTDQKASLDMWTEYFLSEDSSSFPMWAKYWAYKGMLKLGKYNKEKESFEKRTKSTTSPFIDLNREALALVVDSIIKKVNKEEISEDINTEEFKKLLQGSNFGKLYAYAIEKVTPAEEGELLNTKGEWITYKQGSDHMPLVNSLQGKGTGWCTAGESTAKSQLTSGDFHVYYSYDANGEAAIPRIAIRKQGSNIAEIRGISAQQNMDPTIASTNILETKLQEFGNEGEVYKKKDSDMKRLTEIDTRFKNGEELSKEDLRFLYEVDGDIEGFGYWTDPRVDEILQNRKLKKDLSLIFNCNEEQISTTKDKALSGDILYHHGELNLNDFNSAEGLNLPGTIGGSLFLKGLSSAEGLNLPETISESLALSGLSSAEGLNLPSTLGGLFLDNLSSAKGLNLPKTINGNLDLNSLSSAEGLNLPSTLGGLFLKNLRSAEGLNLPETIDGSLDLDGLSNVEGLKLPDTINGSLNLDGLSSAKGLNLPKTINGNLDLNSLSSAEGLNLPSTLGGLFLKNLRSAEGLNLPETIDGSLDLSGLSSAEGLELPDTINGSLFLRGLSSAEKEEIKTKYPNLNIY